MPISHSRRARVPQSMSVRSQAILVHALSLHRSSGGPTPRQSRFVRSFMRSKEDEVHAERDISARIHALLTHKRKSARCFDPVSSSSPVFTTARISNLTPRVDSISERRSGRSMPSLLPLQNLIPPSKFSSPLTPADQVLHTPFEPPKPHKATPRTWKWTPRLFHRLTSPEVDENTPASPESPICNLTRRFSHIAPLASTKHVPRRLSYSRGYGSHWSPETRCSGQALASPVLIRSTLWTPSSPVASPRYQLDEFQFSPFHVSTV